MDRTALGLAPHLAEGIPAEQFEALRKNNRFYSPTFERIACEVAASETLRPLRLNLDLDDVAPYMRGYPAKVNPWPVFVGRDALGALGSVCSSFGSVLNNAFSVAARVPDFDLAGFLQVSPVVVELLVGGSFDTRELLIRHDIVFSQNVPKIVEANSGSSIGGWQLDWLEPNYRRIIANTGLIDESTIFYRGVCRSLLSSIMSAIMRLRGARACGNVAMLVPPGVPDGESLFGDELQKLYGLVCRQALLDGRIVFFSDFRDLEFERDGAVRCRGQAVDYVHLNVPIDQGLPPEIAYRLISSALARRIVFPDSPAHRAFGNKLAPALLHDPRIRQQLSEEDLNFVDKHIPWAAPANSEKVVWEGSVRPLRRLLLEDRARFVLKKSQSFQGLDVVIGAFSEERDWLSAVDLVAREPGWVAQEYCKPDKVLAVDPDEGPLSFDFVWGAFQFKDAYGGCFVRGVPQKIGCSYDGVINSARGASEFPVFEDLARKQRIVL